jgi:hypothetical protein
MKKKIKIPDKCHTSHCRFCVPKNAYGFLLCALYDFPLTKKLVESGIKPPWCKVKKVVIDEEEN